MTQNMNRIAQGREFIAQLAEKEGETEFAEQVRFGCWDHRNDVAKAINGERFQVRKLNE